MNFHLLFYSAGEEKITTQRSLIAPILGGKDP